VVEGFGALRPPLDAAANARAEVLPESHLRAREARRAGGRRPVLEPFLPVDLLGYTVDEGVRLIYLEAIGLRENFYRDLKR
jgi:hypothetical protein